MPTLPARRPPYAGLPQHVDLCGDSREAFLIDAGEHLAPHVSPTVLIRGDLLCAQSREDIRSEHPVQRPFARRKDVTNWPSPAGAASFWNDRGGVALPISYGVREEPIMDREHIKGAGEKVKGAVKDTVGKVTGDKKMQAEGKMDKAKGAAHSAVGDAKDTVRDAIVIETQQRRRGS